MEERPELGRHGRRLGFPAQWRSKGVRGSVEGRRGSRRAWKEVGASAVGGGGLLCLPVVVAAA